MKEAAFVPLTLNCTPIDNLVEEWRARVFWSALTSKPIGDVNSKAYFIQTFHAMSGFGNNRLSCVRGITCSVFRSVSFKVKPVYVTNDSFDAKSALMKQDHNSRKFKSILAKMLRKWTLNFRFLIFTVGHQVKRGSPILRSILSLIHFSPSGSFQKNLDIETWRVN